MNSQTFRRISKKKRKDLFLRSDDGTFASECVHKEEGKE